MRVAYERGLHELGDGLLAYLQPDGTWGWSNAGLITAGGTSLLVDTLFDFELTREMLDAMRPVTDLHPIDAAMNTHGNGDHCFGNALLPDGAEIYATAGAAAELKAAPPELVNTLKHTDQLGPEFSAYIRRIFGPFSFEDVELRPPTATFEGALVLRAGDRILALGAHTLVPGHGPVTDASGVHDVKRYLSYVHDQARARFDAGMDAEQAAHDIDLSDFSGWGDPERIAVNVEAVYRELDPGRDPPARPELFLRMARWASRH